MKDHKVSKKVKDAIYVNNLKETLSFYLDRCKKLRMEMETQQTLLRGFLLTLAKQHGEETENGFKIQIKPDDESNEYILGLAISENEEVITLMFDRKDENKNGNTDGIEPYKEIEKESC